MKTLFQKFIAVSLTLALVGTTTGVSEAVLASPVPHRTAGLAAQASFNENAMVESLVNFRSSFPKVSIGRLLRGLVAGVPSSTPEEEAEVPAALKAMPSPGYILVGGALTLGLHVALAYLGDTSPNGVSQACGDAFIIASAAHWTMPRLLNLYGRFIRLIDLRGRQSGGTVTYFGDGAGLRARVKNPKRGDLSNNMVRTFRFAWFLRRIERAIHFTGLKTPAAWIPNSDGLSVLVRMAARQKIAQEKSRHRITAAGAARQVQIASGILRLAGEQELVASAAPERQTLAFNAMDQAVRSTTPSGNSPAQLRAALSRAVGTLLKPLAPVTVSAQNRPAVTPRAPRAVKAKPALPNLKRFDRTPAAPRLYPNLPRFPGKMKSSSTAPTPVPPAVPKKMSSAEPRGTPSVAGFSFFAFAWIAPLFSWRRLFARRSVGERALQTAA